MDSVVPDAGLIVALATNRGVSAIDQAGAYLRDQDFELVTFHPAVSEGVSVVSGILPCNGIDDVDAAAEAFLALHHHCALMGMGGPEAALRFY